MQAYQNYYQSPMFNQSMQQHNPYMQRMDYLQQFQQSLQQPVSNNNQFVPMGKIVENMDMVKATDIPMDGNMYYFPKADGTEIYSKQWLANGTTQIKAFKPILETEPNGLLLGENKIEYEAIFDLVNGFNDKIDMLTNKVDEVLKQKTTPKVKKEVSTDD